MSVDTSNYLGPGEGNKVKVVAGYVLQQRLGSGSFAVVYKGVRLPQYSAVSTTASSNSGADTVAIKAIARTSEKLTKKVLQNLEIEISILRTYRHHNIVCMHDVQKTERHFYLLLEYCAGGDVQGLIRSRRAGRLSEGLTRRLMRDLAAGLRFLWGQELIHRDIKPQNLLLTGPLPLEEFDDPAKTPEQEEARQRANFPSSQFALKIADFGFARHLQSQSLAETLCGSPIYMAPEILQHQRYDAKADLWSVGTVLFEMIAGKPPFHGENHIDLLKNIKMKAVRLPPDVRVSKECVTLLRLLLNRNPLSRAGFKEFFEACDAFVALGCKGLPISDPGTYKPSVTDLETIPENDGGVTTQDNALSLVTVATGTPYHVPPRASDPGTLASPSAGFAAPPLGPTIHHAPPSYVRTNNAQRQPLSLAPLMPSPPSTGNLYSRRGGAEPPLLELSTLESQSMERQVQMVETTTRRTDNMMQNSMDDNSYVMVEHGCTTAKATGISGFPASEQDMRPRPEIGMPSPSSGSFFTGNATILGGRRESFKVMKQAKGMLSTSPGTGGALMGMLVGGRARLLGREMDGAKKVEIQIFDATKMLATAEDIGRRAITVAHLGDNRAFHAMKLIMMNDSNSSLISATPMEGLEDDARDHDSGAVTDDSSSTELMTVTRRRRASSSDKSMTDAKAEEEAEEMPFALPAEPAPMVETVIAMRSNTHKGSASTFSSSGVRQPQLAKPTPHSIRAYFSDALLCYLKALAMLKGSIGAIGKVIKEIEALQTHRLTTDQNVHIQQLKARCGITSTWLSDQFRGVLERADATNAEIAKLPAHSAEARPTNVTVEELIYNHALTCGREGAVKQLLGQHEASRSCYRSAGLLLETLLMEPRIEGEDRKTLESYVDGFAARINELDETMLQQSRLSTGSSGATNSRRGPSVVGLVGQSFNVTRPGFV